MSGAWELVVLGVAQDGGVPHPGCHCVTCAAARSGRLPRQSAACVGLRRDDGHAILIDATPDLPDQIHRLTGGRLPDAILLTHAHLGHYLGLAYLGREAWGARGVPVLATQAMLAFLAAHQPWRALIDEGRIVPSPLVAGQRRWLAEGVSVLPLAVPHRGEHSDTLGLRLDGPRASLLYVPDIDRWDDWPELAAQADTVDHALLDATFARASELPPSVRQRVPHPLVADTRSRLAGRRARLWLTHLNHTNRLLTEGAPDLAREGMTLGL